MKIGKIRFVNEILTEQMNHWMLFPLALIVGGASRYLTGEGDSMLLAWVLCSLFPFFFFLKNTSGDRKTCPLDYSLSVTMCQKNTGLL